MHQFTLKGCLGIALAVLASGCSNDDSLTPAATGASSDPAGTASVEEILPRVASWDENVPSKGSCSLDTVNGSNPVDGKVEVDRTMEVTFEGWSVTSDLQSPSQVRVYLIGFDKFELEALAGLPREDVAKAVGLGAATAGFRVAATRMMLPAGAYKVLIGSTSANLGLEICDTKSVLKVR